MSLEKEIEELEKQLAEAEKQENVEPKPESQEPAAEPVAEEPKEEKTEEPEKPEEKPAEKPEELDDKGYARLRREAKAAEKRAEAEAARVRELEEKLKAKENPEPTEEASLAPQLREIIEDHTISRAERELQNYEAAARASNPDYDAVAGAYTSSVFSSLRVLNPDKSQFELLDMTKRKVLETAANLLNKGYENPAEEMYNRAKEMGFKAQPKEEPASREEKVKPDIAKVAANRARSSNMAAAGGESKGNMTLAYAATELTAAQVAKLSDAEFRALISQGK